MQLIIWNNSFVVLFLVLQLFNLAITKSSENVGNEESGDDTDDSVTDIFGTFAPTTGDEVWDKVDKSETEDTGETGTEGHTEVYEEGEDSEGENSGEAEKDSGPGYATPQLPSWVTPPSGGVVAAIAESDAVQHAASGDTEDLVEEEVEVMMEMMESVSTVTLAAVSVALDSMEESAEVATGQTLASAFQRCIISMNELEDALGDIETLLIDVSAADLESSADKFVDMAETLGEISEEMSHAQLALVDALPEEAPADQHTTKVISTALHFQAFIIHKVTNLILVTSDIGTAIDSLQY